LWEEDWFRHFPGVWFLGGGWIRHFPGVEGLGLVSGKRAGSDSFQGSGFWEEVGSDILQELSF